ncbi:kynurenine 3-monooxygenase [Ophiostoma piceae UAMH 11346]|uniref:Kynurenine 3-monooxygenase n=1 Tax=Ophiostoma piceae (strain UAMH 11346) TaxID=1262450 RepID=S3CUQ3_OPHP1|nr:kynurenine 3-monooxygenase [Ophiostoma piceae UAMH 11346]
MAETPGQKTVVVGAGPVGSLAALYAAQRGDDVEVYELRNDLRDPSTTPLNFTRSINLALSERGIHALKNSGSDALLDHVFDATIPMRGRMIHGRTPTGDLYEEAQDYDIHGRTIFAIDRAGLNSRLLDVLEQLPNVKLFFNHKLTGADFRKCKAWFEIQDGSSNKNDRAREVEIDFDFMIGADGAHSAVRHHLMKYARMDYKQEYIDTLWCEFRIEPKADVSPVDPVSKFVISPNHLHIWPGRVFMFIAIPSDDGSFTCTLFLPSAEFAHLETQPDQLLPEFFDRHFPGVTSHIAPKDLISQFTQNPHLPLISINCKPHHFQASAVIVGDAAHAMVPFYGQGMNAGLEDVRVLFSILDKHAIQETNQPDSEGSDNGSTAVASVAKRGLALAEYSALRVPDAFAINDLALQNYIEMRASVLSPSYRLRKYLEERLSVHVPWLGWQTKYARVSFGNERYSEVVEKSEFQGRVLLGGLVGAVGLPVLTGLIVLLRWRLAGARGSNVLGTQLRGLFGWVASIWR